MEFGILFHKGDVFFALSKPKVLEGNQSSSGSLVKESKKKKIVNEEYNLFNINNERDVQTLNSNRFLFLDKDIKIDKENFELNFISLLLKYNLNNSLIELWTIGIDNNKEYLALNEIINSLTENIEIDKLLFKYIVIYYLLQLPHFEIMKNKENFKLVAQNKVKEIEYKNLIKKQLNNFELNNNDLIFTSKEEEIKFKIILMDILFKNNKSAYWVEYLPVWKSFIGHSITLQSKIKEWLFKLNINLDWTEIFLLNLIVFSENELNEIINYLINQEKDILQKIVNKFNLEQIINDYKTELQNINNNPNFKQYNNVITIDSYGTTDIDDGISILERTNDKLTVAIHIANTSHFLFNYLGNGNFKKLLENEVFKEACRKTTSIYATLPDCSFLFRKLNHAIERYSKSSEEEVEITKLRELSVIPMLPPIISEDLLSLRKEETNEIKLTISYEFNFYLDKDPELIGVYNGFTIIDKNISYEQADSELFGNNNNSVQSDWEFLYNCCRRIYDNRINSTTAKAYDQHKSLIPVPLNYEDVELQISSRRQYKSSMIVSETAMIVSGSMVKYFKENSLNGVNKGFDESKNRPITNLLNDNNSKCYLQQTSPLRRWNDTLTQLQLYLFLMKKPTIDDKTLQSLIYNMDNMSQIVPQLEEKILNFWILKYFERSNTRELKGDIVGKENDRFLFKLTEDKYCKYNITIIFTHKIQPQEKEITVIIEAFDYEQGLIKCSNKE